jgi:hypothetical protein
MARTRISKNPEVPIELKDSRLPGLEGRTLTVPPDAVAAGKAQLFPNEGGAAIVEIEVPQSIVQKADLGGEVRFEPGYSLEELLAAWPSLPKRILPP